jgi:hypothetical protein
LGKNALDLPGVEDNDAGDEEDRDMVFIDTAPFYPGPTP